MCPPRAIDTSKIIPSFVDFPDGRLLIIEVVGEASAARNHAIVIIPPFAEEMNKCRRMVNLQARSLANLGFRVIIFDLFGTGDSDGEFSEANWEKWCQNIASVVAWSTEHCGSQYSFITVRTGCLLLAATNKQILQDAQRLVCWQACANGELFLRQFLRLRLAAQLVSGSADSESLADLVDLINAGTSLEIAGYHLSSDLAKSLQAASFDLSHLSDVPPVHFIDIVASKDVMPPVATTKLAEQWRSQGAAVSSETVVGDRFWDSVEIVTVPRLVEATSQIFCAD